jgi:hypothetical protein
VDVRPFLPTFVRCEVIEGWHRLVTVAGKEAAWLHLNRFQAHTVDGVLALW